MKETSFFHRGAAHLYLSSRWSGVVAAFACLWFSVAAQAIEGDPITLAVGLNNPQDMVMDATTIY